MLEVVDIQYVKRHLFLVSVSASQSQLLKIVKFVRFNFEQSPIQFCGLSIDDHIAVHYQLTNTELSKPLSDKHIDSFDSEDDFCSGCQNVSHQQLFFSEQPSPRWSHYTNYWYSWVQIIYYTTNYIQIKNPRETY